MPLIVAVLALAVVVLAFEAARLRTRVARLERARDVARRHIDYLHGALDPEPAAEAPAPLPRPLARA